MGNGICCKSQEQDTTTYCCGTCGCDNCKGQDPLPILEVRQQSGDFQMGSVKMNQSNIIIMDQSQQQNQSQMVQGQNSLFLGCGLKGLDPMIQSQVKYSNTDLGQLLSPKSILLDGSQQHSNNQNQQNQYQSGSQGQILLFPSLGHSQFSNNQQNLLGQQTTQQQQLGPQAVSLSFVRQQQLQNQNIIGYQDWQQQQIDNQNQNQNQLSLQNDQQANQLLQEQQQDQETIFQTQQKQLQDIYNQKLIDELKHMVKHQSLDEPLLPKFHLFFDQSQGDDGHDKTLDPYHGPVYVLNHKLNPNFRLCMKVMTIGNYEEWELQERKLQQQKLEFTHPHLINIHLIHSRKFLCLCSATFRICLLLDYIHTDLMMLSQTKNFYEDELWNILDSMIDVLYLLQLKGIAHQNVKLSHIVLSRLIDNKEMYKLLYMPEEKPMIDQLMTQGGITNTSIPKLKDEKTGETLYVSPFQWKLLIEKQQKPPQLQNQVKSDVFTLGMVILHLALGPSRHQMLIEVYDPDELNVTKLLAQVRLLKDNYSKDLIDVLNLMLTVNETNRPDWVTLSEKMSGLNQRKVFSHSLGTDIYIYTMELQSRQEKRIFLQKQSEIKNNQSQKFKSPTQSIIPSHLSEIKSAQQKLDKTHHVEEDEFILQQFLLSGTQVEQRCRKKLQMEFCDYDGEIVNGKRDGIGQAQFLDGKMYDGCWKNDQMNGQGTMYSKDGIQIYIGLFKDGQYNGFGVQRNSNPYNLREPFDYSDFSKLKDSWISYEGDHIYGLYQGFGSLTLTNKEKFTGVFQDGLPQGVGVYSTMELNCINGQWDLGVLIKRL